MPGDDLSDLRTKSPTGEGIAPNPDLSEDLGYDLIDLEVIAPDDSGRVLIIPSEEDMIRDDAFIVADARSLVDPTDRV